MQPVLDWLGRHLPQSGAAALLHNDYRLDNCLLDTTDPAYIVAVLDWDMCTQGDPLADLGYVLNYGGKNFYFAGDTEGTPEMRALKNIDVAFIPMNLPYTMTPAEAADAVKAFHPKVAIPYHYKGQDINQFKAALAGTGIEVRLLEWYPS